MRPWWLLGLYLSTPVWAAPAQDVADGIERIAADYASVERAQDPDDALPWRSAAAIAARDAAEQQLLDRLNSLDRHMLTGTAAVAYAVLAENLQTRLALRVCRREFWDINHLTGWQITLPPLAAGASIKTADDRARALRRWSTLPVYLDTEIDNLRTGLRLGYSVPRTVVLRVIGQLDALLKLGVDGSPFNHASGQADPEFSAQWRALIGASINPSIRRYAQFLRAEYLPAARDGIAVSELPHGALCYAAFLRRSTTLDRTPRATFALGEQTVRSSRSELASLGSRLFGSTGMTKILERARDAPANRFESADELLAYSQFMLHRSSEMSAALFFALPAQPIEIAPLPDYQRGSGIASHYEVVDSVTRPAYYRIDLDDWENTLRGAAAVTVVHEAIPGHHLQTAAARGVHLPGAAADAAFNSAYIEGWANYVERLCEENGFYDEPYAAIFRRSVLGLSLMIDPAVHVMGWSRGRVRKLLQPLGQTDAEIDALLDRIAVQPGQLTSYETGGLEILALREESRRAFGARFDIREFHRRVLEEGSVPLSRLRQHVEAWFRADQGTAR